MDSNLTLMEQKLRTTSMPVSCLFGNQMIGLGHIDKCIKLYTHTYILYCIIYIMTLCIINFVTYNCLQELQSRFVLIL